MTTELDFSALALANEAMFTASDARRSAITPKTLHKAVKLAVLRQIIRGVYSVRPAPASRSDHLRELTLAMLLSNKHVAATGRSAAVLYELPLFGVNFKRAQGVWTNDNATRHTSDVLIRRPLVVPMTKDLDGWPVVTPPWALIDLARDAGVVPGIVAMDGALHAGLTTKDEVEATIDQLRGSHRMERARAMVARADGRRESAGESRLAVILEDGGIDVVPQFEIRRRESRRNAYVDFRVAGKNVLIEFDGMVKYRGDEGAVALAEEKAREDELRRQGWVFVRVVWADLAHPARILAWVNQAMDTLSA